MCEPRNHIKAFLASQEAAMKDFITGFYKDLGIEELKAELSLHHERLEAFIDSIHEPLPASVTSQATPIAFATPIRGKAPTHTSSGKALRIAGAGTLFRSGSDKKRLPHQITTMLTQMFLLTTSSSKKVLQPRARSGQNPMPAN
jgi:hypothetical protein